MTQDILNTHYWRRRLEEAPVDALHHAIFKCSTAKWRAIENKHREILNRTLPPSSHILDCGCGWGRLIELLPESWDGVYYGIDLSPEFVAKARKLYGESPTRQFHVGDLRDLSRFNGWKIDWAILISIRPMMKRNLGEDMWKQMEAEISRLASNLLYLEYDENNEGSIE